MLHQRQGSQGRRPHAVLAGHVHGVSSLVQSYHETLTLMYAHKQRCSFESACSMQNMVCCRCKSSLMKNVQEGSSLG
jgi:hypothetical protein